MKRAPALIVFVFSWASATLFATQHTVPVSVDDTGKVTIAKRTPNIGGLKQRDHIHWQADDPSCHLDIDIRDLDTGQPEKWKKPDDHGNSDHADVDTPRKNKKASYRYKVHIWCGKGKDGTADYADPELVVSGTRQHRHHEKSEADGQNDQSYRIDVDVDAGTMADKSPIIEKGQHVHWHAKNGKITSVKFVSVSNATCNRDCDRDTDDLEPCEHYKYSVTGIDKNGATKNVDPELVISGTCLKGRHPRRAKE